MKYGYYWNDKIPTSVSYSKDPKSFFYSLLYEYNQYSAPDGDRFSWIQDNYLELQAMLSGVVSNEIGFEYQLYAYTDKDVFGEIAYVKPGTDAAAKGLKRGQVFTHVNDVALTVYNYQALLAFDASSVKLRIADPAINHISKIFNFNNAQNITLNLLSTYAENPVYLDTVYNISGKKIGYLVYNFFASDDGDETGAYDKALNNVFADFKSNGITELILDLRYNSGGSLLSAIYLASMIVKNLNTSDVFLKVEYNNQLQQEYIKAYGAKSLNSTFVDKVTVYGNNDKVKSEAALSNLGNVQTLYVLTGKHTASASEMVINGLKPYMSVYLVGDTTIGKNVGSTTIYDERNTSNKWGMQPIIAKFYNSNNQSDFTAGFVPNELEQDTWNMPKKQLGDIQEALLSGALQTITGGNLHAMAKQIHLQKPASIRAQTLRSSLDKKAWRNQIIIPGNSKFEKVQP